MASQVSGFCVGIVSIVLRGLFACTGLCNVLQGAATVSTRITDGAIGPPQQVYVIISRAARVFSGLVSFAQGLRLDSALGSRCTRFRSTWVAERAEAWNEPEFCDIFDRKSHL